MNSLPIPPPQPEEELITYFKPRGFYYGSQNRPWFVIPVPVVGHDHYKLK